MTPYYPPEQEEQSQHPHMFENGEMPSLTAFTSLEV